MKADTPDDSAMAGIKRAQNSVLVRFPSGHSPDHTGSRKYRKTRSHDSSHRATGIIMYSTE